MFSVAEFLRAEKRSSYREFMSVSVSIWRDSISSDTGRIFVLYATIASAGALCQAGNFAFGRFKNWCVQTDLNSATGGKWSDVIGKYESVLGTCNFFSKLPRQVTKSPRQVTKSPRQVTKSPRQVTKSPRQVTKSSRQVTKLPWQVNKLPRQVNKWPRQDTILPWRDINLGLNVLHFVWKTNTVKLF
jgi:hypothetical protein